MTRSLFILGTSGLAREVAHLATLVAAGGKAWDEILFIGEPGCQVGEDLGLGSIAGDDDWLLESGLTGDVAAGIGKPEAKARALSPLLNERSRFGFPNLIHPNSDFDSDRVSLGEGNILTSGTIFSIDIVCHDFNLFNWNLTVGHDAEIGSFNVFNPSVNISGFVNVGDRVLVGTGAQILENLQIGSDSAVGAGAVVTRDVAPGTTVVGIPACPIRRTDSRESKKGR